MVVVKNKDSSEFVDKNASVLSGCSATRYDVTTTRELCGVLSIKNICVLPCNFNDSGITGLCTVPTEDVTKPYLAARAQKNMNPMTNVFCIDWELVSTIERFVESTTIGLESIEEKFNSIYPDLKTYVITPSYSHIEKNKLFKAHIWVVMDKPYEIDHIKRYLFSKLPQGAFVQGLNKAGSVSNQILYFDKSIYTPERFLFEHPQGMERAIVRMTDDNDVNTIDITKSIATYKPNHIYKPVYTPEEKEILTEKSIETEAVKTKKTVKEVRQYRALRVRGIAALNDVVVLPNGSTLTVRQVRDAGKNIRCYPFGETDGAYSTAMSYDSKRETFKDYHGEVVYKIKNIYHYDDYITNIPSTSMSIPAACVIHAPTGSGKTTLFDKPLHLIAVPRRAQTTNNAGFSSQELLSALNNSDKAVKITHDKLLSHLRNQWFVDKLIEYGIKIVIDEAHRLSKDQKYKELWELNTVFISGTLSSDFRGDLPHIFFERRRGRDDIELSYSVPKVTGANNISFIYAERAYMMMRTYPHSCYVAKEKYSTKTAKAYHVTLPPEVLTMNGGGTSAYGEGVDIVVEDGLHVTVYVMMSLCPMWSYSDAVQALNRFRGDNVRRVIVVDGKEDIDELLKRVANTYDIAGYYNFKKDDEVTPGVAFMAAAGRVSYKMKYEPSGYKKADHFGMQRNLDHSNKRMLPPGYNYIKYQGEVCEQVWVDNYLNVTEDELEREVYTFEYQGVKYETHSKKVKAWLKFAESGVLLDIFRIVESRKGDLQSLSHGLYVFYRKNGIKSSGQLSLEDTYHALKHLFKLSVFNKKGLQVKRYTENIERVEIVDMMPFEYWKKESFKANIMTPKKAVFFFRYTPKKGLFDV